MSKNSDDFKERLFGGIQLLPSPGGFQPDLAKLAEELEGENSVVRFFCSGCGQDVEYDQIGASALCGVAKISELDSYKGKFFAAKSCVLCSKSIPREVELRDLSS